MTVSVMVMGTASHVGKSTLAAALCRIFKQDGYAVAPFKVQNMSRNSAVTPDGLEISRAQAVQAEAAGIPPSVHMNPILLKPTDYHSSQVIVHGRVQSQASAGRYMRSDKAALWAAAVQSFQYLAERFSLIVMEGAGSPVEMNLKAHDLTNMRAAELADARVVLVGDIERGGVFASVLGTLDLMTPAERARVVGIVINKFRGDPTLFDDGVAFLEERSGIPVLGVLPYLPHLDIGEEDSLGLDAPRYAPRGGRALRVGVVPWPHLANFTDLDPLFWEPDVDPFFCRSPEDLAQAAAVILPGTNNTMRDLSWMHAKGWVPALNAVMSSGRPILGICGGYQMMGQVVADPLHLESEAAAVPGLGWLPIETTLTAPKRTTWVEGHLASSAAPVVVKGYEIHMGRTRALAPVAPLATVQAPDEPGPRLEGAVSANLTGTYLHGVLDNDGFRALWLREVRNQAGPLEPTVAVSAAAMREEAYDRLATAVRGHLRLSTLYAALGLTPPAALTRVVPS